MPTEWALLYLHFKDKTVVLGFIAFLFSDMHSNCIQYANSDIHSKLINIYKSKISLECLYSASS